MAKSLEDAAFRYLALDGFESRLHRWRFNLTTGKATEEQLSDGFTEFGMVNPDVASSRIAATSTRPPASPAGSCSTDWLHDLKTGTEERISFGPGVFGSETPMAPRVGSTGEDDGYLVTFTVDMNDDASYCLSFDAARLSDGPVCKLRLPERICSGTHSTWVPAADLRQ